MMRAWARRAATLHDELAEIAEVDWRWWLVAAAAAAAETAPPRAGYVKRDADPDADALLGHAIPPPRDPIADAIARACAARTALLELDGVLPDQPLAVTVRKDGQAEAALEPSALDAAAFAVGDRVLIAQLADPALPARLAAFTSATGAPPPPPPAGGPVPFVCVSLGEDPLEVARHAHRRGWRAGRGPWLGLGRAGGLATCSTCHIVVDGYGHTRITGRILELTAAPPGPAEIGPPLPPLPPLAPVPDAVPLGAAWRELPMPAPSVLPLTYALGAILHRRLGRPGARFSPTLQVPVAPGRLGDPLRRRRRVISAAVSVRFEGGAPEPYAAFEARARASLRREAEGAGLASRLIAAVRAVPAPITWKRRGIGASRPPWLDRFAEVLGGRASLSRIRVDAPIAPTFAVSPPPRLATAADPLGACVITIVDDGARAAITACGSGLAGTAASARELLDELLATAAPALPAAG
ncbi:MAG TPA: hypothetical protein VNO30_16065 [Kofleriaceae bacterium]|nr:hypothetical protein [Kofleriaceae bacterium]